MVSLLLTVLIIIAAQVIAFTPSSSVGQVYHMRSIAKGLGMSTMERAVMDSPFFATMETTTLSTSEFLPTTVDVHQFTSTQTVQSLAYPKFFDPNLQRWTRRLDTHEDPFNIHKWAGLGWLLSSTAIVTSGFVYGLQEVPSILEPITYLFVISTITQSLTSIPMAIKHRANEPSIQRGFISSAISSTSTALTGFWLGPYGDHNYFGLHLTNLPDIGLVLVALIMLGESVNNLNAFGDLKDIMANIKDMDPVKDTQAITDRISTSIATFPIGLPMNVAMLQQLWIHATDARADFLDILVSRGSSSELVFYASMITSITICIGNLTSTLHHRKLISNRVNNFALVFSIMTSLFVNIIAAGVNL